MQVRIIGYVVGADKVQGKTIWKVRIKDETNEFNGKKYVVASVHDNIYLAKGLEVTFFLGQFQEDGQVVQRAVDVQLFTEKREKEIPMKKTQTTDDETLHIIVSEFQGEINVILSGCETMEEAKEFFVTAGSENEKVFCVLPFNIYDWTEEQDDPDIINGFGVIRSLMTITPTLQALERMMTAVLRTYAKGV